MSSMQPYRVEAYNTAKQSENKIHDDAVARQYGFSGGLVPGVEVLAYMMHAPIARWGRTFLERGRIVESGRHDELLSGMGLYYAMWRQQVGERRIAPPASLPALPAARVPA